METLFSMCCIISAFSVFGFTCVGLDAWFNKGDGEENDDV